MIVVDANLLLYAVNRDLPQHNAARVWWESLLSRNTSVGLAWVVMLAFLRISTHPRIFECPLSIEGASSYVDEWLAVPGVKPIAPGHLHWQILQPLLIQSGTGGNLTTDAHLAALAIEQGGTLYSADNDFKRFSGLIHVNPLAN
ncbi:putative ribonuclease VapC33 [Thiorhodovibrio winogradskyi]|uniref:Ribonuclease VapC n=1 Tax=Thiorhodovibrio winogradskyi TaxID=77007 RepID=A0ABZ0S7A8_9GAMM|nr:type II toxin-antitoxin system VapC family toxin [Thiorhodovibrio winogradskyi]